MSLLSAAENVIKYGTVLGLVSDKIGLTGKGGLVHDDDEDEVAILHENCLELVESAVTIPWSAIASLESNDDSQMLFVKHIGGLRVEIPYRRFSFDGDPDEINAKIGEIIESTESVDDLMSAAAECDDVNQVVAKVDDAFEYLLESKRLFEMVDKRSSVVSLNAALAILGVHTFVTMLDCKLAEMGNWGMASYEEAADWWRDRSETVVQQLQELLDFWTEEVDDDFSDEAKEIIARVVAESKYCLEFGEIYTLPRLTKDCVMPEDRAYALEHSFVRNGKLRHEERFIKWCDEDFCLPENAKDRKVIVCTEEERRLAHVGEGIDGIAVFRQKDLEKVIECQSQKDPLDTIQGQRAAAPADKGMPLSAAKLAAQKHAEARKARRLVFEQGHPRNGVTYVQHPMSPNTYIDIESFHASMLERKYNELIGILTELGAKEITCSVENSGSSDSKRHYNRSGHFEAGKGGIGNIEGNANLGNDTTKFLSLYKKLDTHLELRPVGDRKLPDNLVFYPFEEGWQRLAKEVLAGRVLKASFDLTYRKDYAVTGKYVKSLSAKIESLIPGYDFNVGGGCESELEEELKELEATTWHYEVNFDSQVESESEPQPKEEKPTVQAVAEASASAIENDEAEAVIRSRAKRYAKTEEAAKSGVLSDAQMADLERLASKYGVSDLRLDKLINEAFV